MALSAAPQRHGLLPRRAAFRAAALEGDDIEQAMQEDILHEELCKRWICVQNTNVLRDAHLLNLYFIHISTPADE